MIKISSILNCKVTMLFSCALITSSCALTVPLYQEIDQSKLVPLLVAAVQELITKVETLEAA